MTFEEFKAWIGNNFLPPFEFKDGSVGELSLFSASVRTMGESGTVSVYGIADKWGSNFAPEEGPAVVVPLQANATEALSKLMSNLDPSSEAG